MSEENKKSFEEVFVEGGEVKVEKLRGAILKYVGEMTDDDMVQKHRIPYNEGDDPATQAFYDFESWISRKTDGYYEFAKSLDGGRDFFKDVFLDLVDNNDKLSDYIDSHVILYVEGEGWVEDSDGGSIKDVDESSTHPYPDVYDVGLVDDDLELNSGKLLGTMVKFANEVEKIEAPSEEPNKSDFISAWNRWMLDRLGSDWIHFTTDKLTPDVLKEHVELAFRKSDDIEDLMEDKWEYDPDELEGNSKNDLPGGIDEWSDYSDDNGTSDNSDSSEREVSAEQSESVSDGVSSSSSSDDRATLSDFDIGDGLENTIINGDSREVVRAIANDKGKAVDAVITDVPYGQDFDPRSEDEDGIEGDSSVSEAMEINRDVFKGMRRIVKKGSPVLTFAGDSCLMEMKDVIDDWYNFKQIMIWNKQHIGMSSMGENPIRWRPNHEYIILACNGEPRMENENRHDGTVLEFKRPHGDDRFHPTEKPPEIMRYLIESLTEEGDVIFDPFAGSGVTLDAARQTGRKYIGVEIDEDFYDKIQERLSQMTLV